MPAGDAVTIFNPNIWIAELGTVLPAMNLALGAAWPTGWTKVKNTEEGVTITSSVPKEDIESDESDGPLTTVPEGGAQINIAWVTITPSMDLVELLGNMTKTAVAADATNSQPAYDQYEINKNGRQFMFGVEGQFEAGALTDGGGIVRAFGYRVEQTDDTEIRLASKGADAAFRPAANVRCLPAGASFDTTTQLQATGITAIDERFNLFVVPAA